MFYFLKRRCSYYSVLIQNRLQNCLLIQVSLCPILYRPTFQVIPKEEIVSLADFFFCRTSLRDGAKLRSMLRNHMQMCLRDVCCFIPSVICWDCSVGRHITDILAPFASLNLTLSVYFPICQMAALLLRCWH
jgi:hypothetical protein